MTEATAPHTVLKMNSDYRIATAAEEESEPLDAADPAWIEEPERRVGMVDDALHGLRLDKAVVSLVPELSRNHLQGLIENGHVRVDGRAATSSSRKVTAGQHLQIDLVPTQETLAFRPEPLRLEVVFEDDHLLVVDKPAGLVVHPAPGNWSGTVLNGLLAHHAAAASLPRAGIVHRLDKDTSGLMVVGKTLAAVTALARAIALREVHRAYVAIAQGRVEPAVFSIEAPVGRDPKSRVRMAVVGSGRAARTDVEVLATDDRFSVVRCKLHTGRTHQIRVHLASRGHSLVGDAVYGGSPALGMSRQALHAVRLEFDHPAGLERIVLTAAPPRDLASALAKLKFPVELRDWIQ